MPNPASPALKANEVFANATFYNVLHKWKNGSALGVSVYAIVVCRARHMFLKMSQSYHVVVTLASLRPGQTGKRQSRKR